MLSDLGLRAPLRAIDVCAGSGIGSSAFEACGFASTVCYIEREPWCQRLLSERMRTGDLLPAPIWDDLREFDGRPWRGCVDFIFGGIPCQPYSVAGKQLGDADERDLWPDLRRIVREVQPRLVLIENVSGFLVHGGGLQRVLGELAADGWDAEWATVSAADLGANHLRKRVWLVAYPGAGRRPGDELRAGRQEPGGDGEVRDSERYGWEDWPLYHSRAQSCEGRTDVALADGWRRDGQPQQQGQGPAGRGRASECREEVADAAGRGQRADGWAPGDAGHADERGATVAAGDVPDADNAEAARQRQHGRRLHAEPEPEGPRECGSATGRLAEPDLGSLADGLAARLDGPACYEWWQHEPDVPRLASGVRERVAQLKCLGNGWVPHVSAYVVGRILAGILAAEEEIANGT